MGSILLGKVVVCAVGIILISIGIRILIGRIHLNKNGIETIATVLNFAKYPDGGVTYICEFMAYDGERIISENNLGYFQYGNSTLKHIGKKIPIIYSKSNFKKLHRKYDISFYFMVLCLLLGGSAFLLLGIFLV